MTILSVGGLGFRNIYKTLEDAIDASRAGDTIQIKKNIKLKTATIRHRLTIEGLGGKLETTKGFAGLVLNGASISLNNLDVEIATQSTLISVDSTFPTDIALNNVTVSYEKRSDSRDWLSCISSRNNRSINLSITKSTVPFINMVAETAVITQSRLGSFFYTKSGLSTNKLTSNHNVLNNIQIFGKDLNQAPKITSTNDITSGLIEIFDMSVNIQNLSFDRYDFTESKYRKSFNDESLFSNQIIGFYLENVTGEINQTTLINDTQQQTYDLTPFVITKSELTITDNRAITNTLSQIIESKINLVTGSQRDYLIENSAFASQETVGKGQSDAYQDLQNLIGLASVKEKLEMFMATAVLNAKRQAQGLATANASIRHMIFGGNAGTGKTTVAKLLGQILFNEGILKSDKFVVATRKDLVGAHVGETALKTHALIESALDGILFIDEAYALTPTGGNDFAQEAVDQLVMDAIEYKDRLIIILAGYSSDMDRFLQSNQGLPSRFPNRIDFPDYTLDELLDMLVIHLNKNHIDMTQDTFDQLEELFTQLYYRNRNAEGGLDGNGRYIEILVNDLIGIRDLRLSRLMTQNRHLSDTDLMSVTSEDIQQLKTMRL